MGELKRGVDSTFANGHLDASSWLVKKIRWVLWELKMHDASMHICP